MIRALAVVDDCTFIVAGHENSVHPGDAQGDSRGFIRRIEVNTNGDATERWEFLLDTAGADTISGLALENDRMWFWGSTTGAIGDYHNLGQRDVVLGSITLSGQLQKISQVGNERPNLPLTLLPTGVQDNLLLVGNDEVYVPTNFVEAWEDPWLSQVAEYPDFFSAPQLSNLRTPGSDYFTAAVFAEESVVTALLSDQGTLRGTSLQRRLQSGEVVWSTPVSDSQYDVISSLHLVGETVVVFGSTYLQLGGSAAGSADFFVAGFDLQTGKQLWLEQFGTAAVDWARHLLAFESGYIATGEMSDAAGNWSATVHRVTAGGAPLATIHVSVGTSLALSAAGLTRDGVMLAGDYRDSADRQIGFLKRVPGSF